MDESVRGKLLVATPGLSNGVFDRTVVFMLEHVGEGALGVIVNRPGGVPVGEVLPDWGDHAATPGEVFFGGPVQRDGIIALRGAGEPFDLEVDPAVLEPDFGPVRVFSGHSGWGSCQLEGELDTGAWWVCDAADTDVLDDEPDTLWERVLSRQSGRLAWFAAYPDDPALN